jgi:hypothetical protein
MTRKSKEETSAEAEKDRLLGVAQMRLSTVIESLAHLNGAVIGTALVSEQALIWPELRAFAAKLPILSISAWLVEHQSNPQDSVLEFRLSVDSSLRHPDSPARKMARSNNQNESYLIGCWADAVKDIDLSTHLMYVKGSFEAIKRMKPLKDKIWELEETIKKYQNERPMGHMMYHPMFGPPWRR